MNEYLRGLFVSSKSGNADTACMDNGHVKGYSGRVWKNGMLVVKLAYKAAETLLRQRDASLSPAWPSSHSPLNSSKGSLLKGFFKEPGTATQVAGSFSVLLGPSGSVSFPPVSPGSRL